MGSTQSLHSPVDIISGWHSGPKERLLFDCGRNEIGQYLQAVHKIQQSPNNGEFERIISMAVARLTNEFRTVLTRQSESAIGPTSVTELSSSVTDTTSYQFKEDYEVSKEVMDYLQNIARMMDSCGYLETCIQVYITARKNCVKIKIIRFRLDDLQAGDKRKFLPEELRMKILRWIQAAKMCIKMFEKEQQLAKQIFNGLGTSTTHEECFLSTVQDATVDLFAFAKAVSTSNQSSERLELILILYGGFSSLLKDFNDLFSFESAKHVRDSTAAILSRLQNGVIRMLSDFENAVLNELSTVSEDGSGVHSLSRYVMEYVNLIVKYRKLLDFVSMPSLVFEGKRLPDVELHDPQSLSPLSLHLILIIAVLQLNLEKKSKNFKDASLGHLFMMNNVHYIVQKIEGSKDLEEIIGAEYLKKLNENEKRAMSNYQKSARGKFLGCFRGCLV